MNIICEVNEGVGHEHVGSGAPKARHHVLQTMHRNLADAHLRLCITQDFLRSRLDFSIDIIQENQLGSKKLITQAEKNNFLAFASTKIRFQTRYENFANQ
jgi:hypothetical protein